VQTWLISVVIGGVVEKRFEAEVQPALSLPRNLCRRHVASTIGLAAISTSHFHRISTTTW
jgi:hypothetical protein